MDHKILRVSSDSLKRLRAMLGHPEPSGSLTLRMSYSGVAVTFTTDETETQKQARNDTC